MKKITDYFKKLWAVLVIEFKKLWAVLVIEFKKLWAVLVIEFKKLWAVLLINFKKLVSYAYNIACAGIVLGLLYFFYHVAIQGNWWQSLASFFIGATISALIVALLAAAGRTDDSSYYESALIDCNTALKTAENNYDLMRLANSSLQKDKDILTADVNRQAQIIAELVTKHNKLYLENDALKAKNVRTGGLSIDSDGKIV